MKTSARELPSAARFVVSEVKATFRPFAVIAGSLLAPLAPESSNSR
jgi:hypothetical protein